MERFWTENLLFPLWSVCLIPTDFSDVHSFCGQLKSGLLPIGGGGAGARAGVVASETDNDNYLLISTLSISLCVWLSVQHLSSIPIQVFSYIQRKTSSHLFPKRKTDFQVAKLNTTPWDNYVLMLILFCEVCLRKYFCLTKIKRSKQSSNSNKKCTKLLSFTAIPD